MLKENKSINPDSGDQDAESKQINPNLYKYLWILTAVIAVVLIFFMNGNKKEVNTFQQKGLTVSSEYQIKSENLNISLSNDKKIDLNSFKVVNKDYQFKISNKQIDLLEICKIVFNRTFTKKQIQIQVNQNIISTDWFNFEDNQFKLEFNIDKINSKIEFKSYYKNDIQKLNLLIADIIFDIEYYINLK